jgi:hypothetical protein
VCIKLHASQTAKSLSGALQVSAADGNSIGERSVVDTIGIVTGKALGTDMAKRTSGSRYWS